MSGGELAMADSKEEFFKPLVFQKTATTGSATVRAVPSGSKFYMEGLIVSGDGVDQQQVQILDDSTVKLKCEIPAASTISFQTFRIPFSVSVVAKTDANTAEVTIVGFELFSGP